MKFDENIMKISVKKIFLNKLEMYFLENFLMTANFLMSYIFTYCLMKSVSKIRKLAKITNTKNSLFSNGKN